MIAAVLGLAALGTAHGVSSTSAPTDWRFLPGQQIGGGAAGALDGVARLQISGAGFNHVCSGTLLAGGTHVLTAAHCVDGIGSIVVGFAVADAVAAVTRTAAAADVRIFPGWNGTFNTGADIAVVALSAPVTGIAGFNLSTTDDIGREHLVSGYGTTGTGATQRESDWSDWGWGHYGFNTFDVTSQVFHDSWGGSGSNRYGETYVVDFDNGTPLNNTLQTVAGMTNDSWSSSRGLGADEALATGGDSGGGDFVWSGSEWLLSGVHSWNWAFCDGRITPSCDSTSFNGTSYGDLSGSTAVFSHVDWINAVVSVPEPAGVWLMLSGLAGLAARRVNQRRAPARCAARTWRGGCRRSS